MPTPLSIILNLKIFIGFFFIIIFINPSIVNFIALEIKFIRTYFILYSSDNISIFPALLFITKSKPLASVCIENIPFKGNIFVNNKNYNKITLIYSRILSK